MATRPPRRQPNRQPRQPRPNPSSNTTPQDIFDFFDPNAELEPDPNDSIDDGFLSRYRNEPTHPPRHHHRRAAASAFDAMDRLLGSGPPDNSSPSQPPSARQKPDSFVRSSWLDDVRARAQTTGEPDPVQDALDVEAGGINVEEEDNNHRPHSVSNARMDERVDTDHDFVGSTEHPDDDAEENDVRNGNSQNKDFDGENITASGTSGTARVSGFKSLQNTNTTAMSRNTNNSSSTKPTSSKSKGSPSNPTSTFSSLMSIARKGPVSNEAPPRHRQEQRSPRQREDHRESRDVKEPRPRAQRETRNRSPRNNDAIRSDASSRERNTDNMRGDSSRKKPNVSHLLGLTKQIMSNQRERWDGDDDFEAVDDDMERVIDLKGRHARDRKDGRRRQRYTTVRRVGRQTRRVLVEPEEWRPLSEEDVGRLRSDHRSLGSRARAGRLQGVATDCTECRGSGLDTCLGCAGAGWVPPTAKGVGKRKEMLAALWNRPNLVVDCNGEAQCVYCNGLGKQLCVKCKGSGSSLRKGFSLSDRYEVFDMFPGVDGDTVYEDEEDDEDEKDDEEEDEFESFQLYQGSAASFDIGKKEGLSREDDDDEGDENNEVEDESEELLAALEAMHHADNEEREGYGMNERRGIMVGNENEDEDVDEDDDDDDDNEEGDGDGFDMVMEDEGNMLEEDDLVDETYEELEDGSEADGLDDEDEGFDSVFNDVD